MLTHTCVHYTTECFQHLSLIHPGYVHAGNQLLPTTQCMETKAEPQHSNHPRWQHSLPAAVSWPDHYWLFLYADHCSHHTWFKIHVSISPDCSHQEAETFPQQVCITKDRGKHREKGGKFCWRVLVLFSGDRVMCFITCYSLVMSWSKGRREPSNEFIF